MNVQVNATLVIQIVHFMIAYAVLRVVLLKPAIAVFEAKEKQRSNIRDVIASYYLLIAREKDTLQRLWREGTAFYEQHGPGDPDQKTLLFTNSFPEQKQLEISEELVSLLVESTAHKLTDRIKTL